MNNAWPILGWTPLAHRVGKVYIQKLQSWSWHKAWTVQTQKFTLTNIESRKFDDDYSSEVQQKLQNPYISPPLTVHLSLWHVIIILYLTCIQLQKNIGVTKFINKLICSVLAFSWHWTRIWSINNFNILSCCASTQSVQGWYAFKVYCFMFMFWEQSQTEYEATSSCFIGNKCCANTYFVNPHNFIYIPVQIPEALSTQIMAWQHEMLCNVTSTHIFHFL